MKTRARSKRRHRASSASASTSSGDTSSGIVGFVSLVAGLSVFAGAVGAEGLDASAFGEGCGLPLRCAGSAVSFRGVVGDAFPEVASVDAGAEAAAVGLWGC